MNKQNRKRKFNKRFFAASNSLESNIHKSSFSSKTFLSNLNINKNNFIQNNINITNKLKIREECCPIADTIGWIIFSCILNALINSYNLDDNLCPYFFY